jgi:lysophospholipase L1-like esterase
MTRGFPRALDSNRIAVEPALRSLLPTPIVHPPLERKVSGAAPVAIAFASLLVLCLVAGRAGAAELIQHVVTLRPSANAPMFQCPTDRQANPYPAHADPGVPSFDAGSALPELEPRSPQPPFAPGPDWPLLSPGRPVRIGIWGDSHMAGAAFRNTLASIFESQGLSVQSSSMAINLTQPDIYLPLRAVCAPRREWTLRAAYQSREPVDVGLDLSTLSSAQRRSHLWLDLRQTGGERRYENLRIRYTASERAVRLAVGADQSPLQPVLLPPRRAGGPALEELVIRSATPIATLQIQVLEGSFQLQGLVGDPAGVRADVTLDSYGLPSATARGWSNANPDTLRLAFSGLRYDIAILAYGTNEGAAEDFDPWSYEADLRRSLKAFRETLASTACVLVGPPDRGVTVGQGVAGVSRDRYRYAARHRAIAQIQRRVAPEFACYFWDWQQAMGGIGSSYSMARTSPALMQRDLTHMTSAGYQWAARELATYLHWLPGDNP